MYSRFVLSLSCRLAGRVLAHPQPPSSLSSVLVGRKVSSFAARPLPFKCLSAALFSSYSSSASGSQAVPKVKEVQALPRKGLVVQDSSTKVVGGNNTGKMSCAADAKQFGQYVLTLDQPVVSLDCVEAFNALSDEEKKYAHYLSQASWYGGLVVLVQTSSESPVIFCLLHDLFKSNGVEGLKTIAISDCGFTEDEWKALLVYTSGFLFNSGNYKGFGDTKIIPGVPLNKLETLISKAKFLALAGGEAEEKWNAVKDKMYSLIDREKQLGLGEKGTTTYFSSNCTVEDSEKVSRFMKSQKQDNYMTRVFKTTEGSVSTYEIRTAGATQDDGTSKVHDFEGAKFTLTAGDYSSLMAKVAKELASAKEFAANENEKRMLDCYIQSFTKGSLDEHKNGSRFWIKDKGPAVETYIGFIETYRDPAGSRAEFEGFVAMVNRPMSAKFNELVENATSFLKLLPWPVEFEKDTFLKPDFTSLDVLTFSGSGIPAGINIPNYDEIRQSEGFKNVSLGNVIPASYKDSVIPFLSDSDKEIMNKYRVPAFEVQVGLHELLGHGSGKLLVKDSNGSINYPAELKNPLTGELVEGSYEHGDSYDSVFSDFGSAYEECRAEAVGLLLCLDKTVLKIFGHEGAEADDIIYSNWLEMVYDGAAKSLEMYQPEAGSWMQAHSQAWFAILQVLVEAGEGLVSVEEKTGSDGKPDLSISMDRSKIDTVGRKAISDFLVKLQVYKSTADVKTARKMFDAYTAVNNDGKYPWAKWREIVMDKKQPRKLFVQHNTEINDSTVSLKSYDASPEGLIQSWIERFPDSSIYDALDSCWRKDQPYF